MKKRKPETRPNREILEKFLAWAKVLGRDPVECIDDCIEVYKTYDQSTYPDHLINLADWKTFSFEIDMEKWDRFKRFAKENYNHSRDMALSIAMNYFVETHEQKLSEVLK